MASEKRDSFHTTVTSTYLLEGLRSPANRTVWQHFVDRYEPLLVNYARRLGLSQEDAQDAAQQTLMAFCKAYQEGKYQRERGRLRSWLFGIAHRQILNFLRKRGKREVQVTDQTGQTGFFARVASEDQLEDVWEQEWRQAVLRQCLQEVRREMDGKTIQAFELFAWKGLRAQRVAEQLGMTSNAVFIAKSRVLRRIRLLLPQMEEIW